MKQRLHEEDGSIVISGLLLALALALLIGTGVDIARAFIARRDLTALADNAALAGSQQLDLDAWRQGALALNRGEAEQAADSAISASPEISGTAQSNGSAITVRVERHVRTIALRLVGIPDLTITATATATPRTP